MFSLMLVDTEVVNWGPNNTEIIVRPELLPMGIRDLNLYEVVHTAPGLPTLVGNGTIFPKLWVWLSDRTIPISRRYAKKVLNALDLTQGQNIDEKARIALAFKALSLTDGYWLKSEADITKQWQDISLLHNRMSEEVTIAALKGETITLRNKSLPTAEVTTNGSYPKAWFRTDEDLTPWLYKAGDIEGSEPKREVDASVALSCLNVIQLPYYISEKYDKLCTKCECMSNDDVSIVPAAEVESWCNRTGKNFIRFTESLDRDNFYKMLIIDYLIANSDRHAYNWGFYMNNETGELLGLHPLFDHNNAFDHKLIEGNSENSRVLSGKSMQDIAKHYARRVDIHLVKPPKKEDFYYPQDYKTFVDRCMECGITYIHDETDYDWHKYRDSICNGLIEDNKEIKEKENEISKY